MKLPAWMRVTRAAPADIANAARALAKQGADKRHARKIEVMNTLRDQMGMPRYEVRS